MVDMHLEVDVIPVADVDRSKQFYGRLGSWVGGSTTTSALRHMMRQSGDDDAIYPFGLRQRPPLATVRRDSPKGRGLRTQAAS
jgi:hypothetical protein